MRELESLPPPIVVGLTPDAPPVTCVYCGADVRVYPVWPGHDAPICLLCYLVHCPPEAPPS
jgi:hypothetical protein